ncbi:MAG: cobalt-precorrin 5A hydrolase [Candidatus Brocadiales bacterium]
MDRLALIAVSKEGIEVAERIKSGLEKRERGEGVSLFASSPFRPLSLKDLTAKTFNKYDGIIFVMAMGIVVRVIAPCIKDKHSDPAVVAVDDVGRYVISVLSGHEGGANALAQRIANILRTDAVITTGTEARKNLIIGIGCGRNTAAARIKQAVETALNNANIPLNQVRLLSTIDLKADEKGLLETSKELGIPLRIVSKQEIETCAKAYNGSKFVKDKIGVGGVCEPAALLAGRKTKLVLPKQNFQGVTIAVAQENLTW